MAGISISAMVGDNGIINKARKASEETERATVKEELETKILELQIEKEKNGEKITKQDIANTISSLDNIEIDLSGKKVEGEYKEFGYDIDEKGNVNVTQKLIGEKPTGKIEISNGEDLETVEVIVSGFLNGGTILSIEALDDIELKEEKNSGESIFLAKDNKTYRFRIRGSNGRMTTLSCIIDNAIPVRDDLLTAISKINSSGIKKVKIIGKTNSDSPDDSVIYSLNVINYKGKMVLDGQTEFDGSTLSGQTYSFGNLSDISNDGKTFATNTVVLKVEGDLVINSGITVTSVKNKYGGPKGLILYCTGTLINNGTVEMNRAGALAKGENVYLIKNNDVEYEYIPMIGGLGGNGASTNKNQIVIGSLGMNGVGRATGGGSGGMAAQKKALKVMKGGLRWKWNKL